jgi:diguanylate cyclase (GGDEF)-like protein/PAS domain S-box-containing protein
MDDGPPAEPIDDRGAGAPEPPSPSATPGDPRVSIFDSITDLAVLVDDDGNILYVNDFARAILGVGPGGGVGQSIADFLHPDDLIRAIEVMTLLVGEQLVVPVTPALYRLRAANGEWVPIEINASTLGPDGLVLVIGRYSGDRDLQERIMQLLTTGMPIPEIVDLVPEFGHWRHPNEHYGVFYSDGDERRSAGSELVAALAELDRGPETPWARALATGEDTIVETANLPTALRVAAQDEGLVACWAVVVPDPISPLPALLISWARAHGPAPSVHRYALEVMSRSLNLILQWRAQIADLEQAARRDPLTGVINRTGFFELLHHAAARRTASTMIGVLYVDLDGFKSVNDQHGHAAGDAVLHTIADRIGHAVRNMDVVARLGGDEFAVLCPELTDEQDLTHVANRIIASVSEPISFGDDRITIGASIGIATAPNASAEADPDGLVDAADRALYQAKAGGRGRWHLAPAGEPA